MRNAYCRTGVFICGKSVRSEKPGWGFTLIELLVVIAVIALMLAILGPSLRRGKEAAARVVCLNGLKQLGAAFVMYADEHDGRIISGDIDLTPYGPPWWVNNVCAFDWSTGGQLSETQQLAAIRSGGLWDYVGTTDAYWCPAGYPGEMLTYAMVISMNGRSVNGSPTFTKMSEIISPSSRLVFLDEGLASPNAWAPRYGLPRWWDMPGNRHSEGNTFSFADGHAEYHKWIGDETRGLGSQDPRVWVGNYEPTTKEGLDDLQWAQMGVWGKLGYTVYF